jgi:hypothetical protein
MLWWRSVGVFGPIGWSLIECAVWPMSVVVRDVGIQDRGQVSVADDEDAVGAFAADGADPAFGDSVRAGRSYRCADDRDLFGSDDGVKAGDELGVSIADQETQLVNPITEIHQQIASLLGHPRPGRVGRDARQVHPAGAQFEEEQDVEPLEEYRVNGEEVAGHDRGGPGCEELAPGRPPRRGAGSSPARFRIRHPVEGATR